MATKSLPLSWATTIMLCAGITLPIVAFAATGVSGITAEESARNWDVIRTQTGAIGVVAFILLLSMILLIRWLLGVQQRDSLKREDAIRADMHKFVAQANEREERLATTLNEVVPAQAKQYTDALGKHTETLVKLTAGVDNLCQHVMAKTLDDASCAPPPKRPRKAGP